MAAIHIRDFCAEDINALVALYNDYIVKTPITFDLVPYTVAQRRDGWLSHYALSGRYRLFVADCEGIAVGYASSSRFASKAAYDTSIETSIYVHPDFVGKGIGRRLYTALFQALVGQDVNRAYAGITLPNEVSIALHRKFGFEQAGVFRAVGRKFDQFWDVAWFEKAL